MLEGFFSKMEALTPARYRWIWNHEGFRRYFANTGWMLAGQVFSLILSFFIGAWLARYLGPTDYGIVNYAVAFAGLFGFIANLGVDSILVRELVKHPEKRDELMGTSFGLKLIGGIIAISLVIASAYFFESSSINRTLIILFSLTFVIQSFNVIYHYFQAQVKAKYNTLSQVIATIITSILKIIFIVSGVHFVWLISIFVIDLVIQSILFIHFYLQQSLNIRNWFFSIKMGKRILSSSWFMMMSAAASFVLLKIDQVMVGRMIGEGAVGLYSVAVKFGEVWYFLPSILCASLFPAIINARKISETLYKQRLINFYLLIFIVALIIALVTTNLAKPIVLLLFGREYYGSISLLKIYAWSGIGLFLAWAVQQRLMVENRLRVIFIAYLSAMLVNIILNIFFISNFGIAGAAWATLISYSLLPVIMIMRK